MSMFDKNIGKEARASLELLRFARNRVGSPKFAAMLYQVDGA